MNIAPSVIPTFRFYKEMLSEYQIAKADGISYVWWMSFLGGMLADTLFFLAASFIIWAVLL